MVRRRAERVVLAGERLIAALPLVVLFLCLLAPSMAHAAWSEGGWPFRRIVEIDPPEKPTGEELAWADIYTAGQHQASGENIRVTTEDGKVVPGRVLMVGPGDRLRVLFAPVGRGKRYYVYFGHPNPPPAPRGTEEINYRCGLLMEMKKYSGQMPNNAKQLEAAWSAGRPLLGRVMLGRLFLGFNPFTEDTSVVARCTGSLKVPADGSYLFAGSAANRGSLWIDGKEVLWIPAGIHDTRFKAVVDLKRGRHDLLFYYISINTDPRISVAWKRPDMTGYEVILAQAFGGFPIHGQSGPFEQKDRALTADMKIEYQGECYFADHYTHRYRFTSGPAKPGAAAPRFDWDFGDGQTASGLTVEHVFLNDGPYAVTVKSGLQTDSKTNRIVVGRDFEHIDAPPGDAMPVQTKIVATYDLSKVPPSWLIWATLLAERAKDAAGLEKAATRLAAVTSGVDRGQAMAALNAASAVLQAQGSVAAAARMWQAVPLDSPLQPAAAVSHAQFLLWRQGEFTSAAKLLQPLVSKFSDDHDLTRLAGQALILNQQVAEGRKLIEGLPADGPLDRQAALTGAMARSIEFYITEGDWESGEETWEKWQRRYPIDFLEGYSVMLRTRLMELAKAPTAAARVAEAFATAMPRSPYSPKLLDRASRLLAKSDPGRSAELRKLLKQKYPEDPLSQ